MQLRHPPGWFGPNRGAHQVKVPWRAGGGGAGRIRASVHPGITTPGQGKLRRVPLCAPGEDGPEL